MPELNFLKLESLLGSPAVEEIYSEVCICILHVQVMWYVCIYSYFCSTS